MATDFVLVTDLTGSFTDDISNIQEAIPPIARSLRGVGEDSQFALASFRDFADDFGTNGYRPDLPLTSSIADLEDTVGGYSAFGGGDGPEAQGTALIEAARGTGLELREGSERIILLSTDALNKIGNSGRPTVDEVRTALEENNATPVFLATDGALSAYQDLIEEIGSGVALEISRDSADLSDTVREASSSLEAVVDAVEETNHGVQEISEAAEDQARSTQRAVEGVEDVAEVSGEVASGSEQVSAAAEEQTATVATIAENADRLRGQAESLSESVSAFDVDVDPEEIEGAESDGVDGAEGSDAVGGDERRDAGNGPVGDADGSPSGDGLAADGDGRPPSSDER